MKCIRLVSTAALVLALAGCANFTKYDPTDVARAKPMRPPLASGNHTVADEGWPFFGQSYMPTDASSH